MRHRPPPPPSLHQQKLPNWHQKLIIQLLVDVLAVCANQKGVAYPAAASQPDDLGQGRECGVKNLH